MPGCPAAAGATAAIPIHRVLDREDQRIASALYLVDQGGADGVQGQRPWVVQRPTELGGIVERHQVSAALLMKHLEQRGLTRLAWAVDHYDPERVRELGKSAVSQPWEEIFHDSSADLS